MAHAPLRLLILDIRYVEAHLLDRAVKDLFWVVFRTVLETRLNTNLLHSAEIRILILLQLIDHAVCGHLVLDLAVLSERLKMIQIIALTAGASNSPAWQGAGDYHQLRRRTIRIYCILCQFHADVW